jgi:hypothetical protein
MTRRKNAWRNSLEAAHERTWQRIAPPTPDARLVGNPDLFHCLAVVRANKMRGFPFGEPSSKST